jgi:hypothetical protein
MSRTFRRFEILLPLRFNDGQTVPDELVADTLLELREKFGAVWLRHRRFRDCGNMRGRYFEMSWCAYLWMLAIRLKISSSSRALKSA